jgi:hypothetical protein
MTEPAHKRKAVSWLSRVFAVNPAGLDWPGGVAVLDLMLVPLVLFWGIGHEQYLLSAIFGVVFTRLADPGGMYRQRVVYMTGFAAIGAGITALGFGIGADAWGWLVLAAFAVTLVGGLTITLGMQDFIAGSQLNVWFIVAVGQAFTLHQFNLAHQHAQTTSYTWAQTLAWAGGAALWIVVSFIAWLVLGRRDSPLAVAETPGDTPRRKLTRPIIMFAVIRALVIGGTAAIAFGLNLSHGFWMPLTAIFAMKRSLVQTTLGAVQRMAGTLIGAGAAMLLLLIPANEQGSRLTTVTHGLEVVALVILMHAMATRLWNYAIFSGAITAAILIMVDVSQPSNYSAEGYRVLWTLAGVGFAVIAMLLASPLAKRTAKAPPGPPADVPAQRKQPAGWQHPALGAQPSHPRRVRRGPPGTAILMS